MILQFVRTHDCESEQYPIQLLSRAAVEPSERKTQTSTKTIVDSLDSHCTRMAVVSAVVVNVNRHEQLTVIQSRVNVQRVNASRQSNKRMHAVHANSTVK